MPCKYKRGTAVPYEKYCVVRNMASCEKEGILKKRSSLEH